jgi:hypothetical protein
MNTGDIAWRKSSHSGDSGNCVEVAWRKSSHSGGDGNCVEVAWPADRVAVRDSKNGGPRLEFEVADWREFLGRIG